MPRRPSQALRDFRSAVAIAEALLKREGRFSDPPNPRNVKIVQGLRGGAAVLMVAAFENYLREVTEEKLYELTLHPLRFNPDNLPEDMVAHNLEETLQRCLRGPFPASITRSNKITGYRQAAQLVVLGVINSTVFSDIARSNPNSKKVKELFRSLGIPDIFSSIKSNFDTKWGSPTARSFVPDTLDSILQRRHQVAHTASVLSLSRLDLHESVRFIKLLADLLDEEIARHIKYILR